MTQVSVIIPIYNEEKSIEDCLKSLEEQTFMDLEIILVDDGSTDKTVELVKMVYSSQFTVVLLQQKHKGPGEARNLGAEKAKGEILVFVDADMTFDNDFIKELVAPIITGKSSGTFSKEELVLNKDNIWSQCWNINKGLPVDRMHPQNYPDKQPVFRAILKTEFNKVKGFDSGGHYNDDWSLSKKLGYQAIAVSGAKFYHNNPDSLSEVFNQSQWVAKRSYKLGILGLLVALIRVSLPISLVIGLIKSIPYLKPQFLIFKVIFDFGAFIGILKYNFSGKGFK